MLQISTWILTGQTFTLQINGTMPPDTLQPPRLSVWFRTKTEDRILPLPILHQTNETFVASYTYELWNLFLYEKMLSQFSVTILDRMRPISVSFPTQEIPGWIFAVEGNTIHLRAKEPITFHPKFQNVRSFFCANRKEQMKMVTWVAFHVLYLPFRLLSVKKNRITFCSNRRDHLSGNPEFVFEELSKSRGLDLQILLNDRGFSLANLFRFFYLYATSRVLLVDDYYHYLSYTPKHPQTKVVQLWHACGAFKTFGFSRLGKDTSLLQSSPNHRQYDAAIVSSPEVAACYAEAFGIPTMNVYPLGVPRTDLFFDTDYRKRVRREFFLAHPSFRGKRILLFAPTFRGGGKGNANYPVWRFPVNRILDELDADTVLLVKMHPYLHERFDVDSKYTDRVVDCSEQAELNDLLFVTDVLITDYSSVVYEASLLKIPMLFYAFDLEDYVNSRDFYVDYCHWIPGKLVKTKEQLIEALQQKDYESDKLEAFYQTHWKNVRGGASSRTAKLISSMLEQYEGGS